MKNKLFLSLLISVFFMNVSAKIFLPSIFSDYMVLQQNSEVAIWGWSEPGEVIRIVASWNSTDTIETSADIMAFWKTKLKTTKAGGPYLVEILGSSNIKLENVMLGEVWICSGQSNMQWSADYGIDKGEEEVANANYPNIRIFDVQRAASEYPQRDCFGSWEVCTPETMRSTSAIGYFFGRELHKDLDVPVGLIVAAWGGTPAEVWIEKSRIENNTLLNKYKFEAANMLIPTTMGASYNGMISPLVPYEIAGSIWYQGESNCGNYNIYALLMQNLVENWRTDFKKDFPFYFVQIAPFNYGADGASAMLREQQDIASKEIANTGMVIVSDLVDDINNIHPKNKLDVGKRLAAFALSETYHKDVGSYKSPAFQSMKIEKAKVHLSFSNVPTGLKCTGNHSSRFQIAGIDQEFIEASARIEGNVIVVSGKHIKEPVAVRYCFDDTSTPDIFSNEGLPLAPFRTDKW